EVFSGFQAASKKDDRWNFEHNLRHNEGCIPEAAGGSGITIMEGNGASRAVSTLRPSRTRCAGRGPAKLPRHPREVAYPAFNFRTRWRKFVLYALPGRKPRRSSSGTFAAGSFEPVA